MADLSDTAVDWTDWLTYSNDHQVAQGALVEGGRANIKGDIVSAQLLRQGEVVLVGVGVQQVRVLDVGCQWRLHSSQAKIMFVNTSRVELVFIPQKKVHSVNIGIVWLHSQGFHCFLSIPSYCSCQAVHSPLPVQHAWPGPALHGHGQQQHADDLADGCPVMPAHDVHHGHQSTG